jgi:hypothetical protein
MKAKINKAVLADLQAAFTPDLESPSGLRWNRWNGSTGMRARDVGSPAGSMTNSGTYIVTLDQARYLAADVLVALHRARHRAEVAV